MPIGGAISRASLSRDQDDELLKHLSKHKIYPYKFRIKKTINNTNFGVADVSGGGRYFALTWTPSYYTGVIYLAANFIISPNTTVGTFALAVSYAPTFSMGDNANPAKIDLEGTDVYTLISNGSAINDFQVFFPLDWYLEAKRPLSLFVWADTTTCTAGSSTIQGQFTYGTMVTSRQ